MHVVAVSWGEIEKLRKRRDTAALLAMLTGDEARGAPKQRRHIGVALQELRDPGSVDVLVTVAREDSDVQVRRIAMRALALIGDRAALPLFVQTLQTSDDVALRVHAIAGLGNSGANEAVQPLVGALRESRAGVRSAAARRLADLGDVAAVEPLRDAVHRAWWRPLHRMALKQSLDRLEERTGPARSDVA